MAHKHMMEDKGYEVRNIEISRADDGSFIYNVHAKKTHKEDNDMMDYKSYTYTYDNVDDIADALEDDLMTPHPHMMKNGMKKSDLENELHRKSKKQTARKY